MSLRTITSHVARFERQNVFFFALLGLFAFERKLDAYLGDTPSTDRESSEGTFRPDTLDYLLVGIASARKKVVQHLLELVKDNEAIPPATKPIVTNRESTLLR